jgi:hypothetical protein
MGKFNNGGFQVYDEVHQMDRKDVEQHRAHAMRLFDVVFHNCERRLIEADGLKRSGRELVFLRGGVEWDWLLGSAVKSVQERVALPV